MTQTHTPGPWVIGGSLVSNGTTTVAMLLRKPAVYGGRRQETRDTDSAAPETGADVDANAHLIAAAPDLLAEAEANARFLDQLAAHLEANDMPGQAGNCTTRAKATRAAIAKAEGRS